MTEEPGKKKDANKKAPVEEGDGKENAELEQFPQISAYLKTIPAALIKFTNTPSEKMPVSLSHPNLLEGPFGLGSLVFPAFQRFNNIYFFKFLYFVVVTGHGIIFALVDLSSKKLDKEFSLSEKERFVMDYSDYHASLLVAILVAHYGGRGNRSKWVAASVFVLGIASIIFALIFHKYEIIKSEQSEAISDAALVFGYTMGFVIGSMRPPQDGNSNGDCCAFMVYTFTVVMFSILVTRSALANLNSLSMGITYTIWRITGSVPAPLVFYKATTNACIYWNINECGIKEHCWIYKAKMVYIVMDLSTALFGLFALYKLDAEVKPRNERMVHPVTKEKESKEEKA